MKRATYMTILLVATGLAGSAYGQQAAAETDAEPLTLRQMALFKNGLGFFIGQATFGADAPTLRFLLPAVPSQGTFWLSHPAQIELARVVAERVQTPGEWLEAITIPEILRANIGRQVRITIDRQLISGRIVAFTEDRREPRPRPYTPGIPEIEMERREIWPPYESGLVILDAEGGTVSLDPGEVRYVTFPNGDIRRQFTRSTDAVEVHVQAAKTAGGQSLTVSFLAKGIAWTPSYLADISNEKTAQLSAKALVINEAYDLHDVTVQLVTGFPRLQYADTFSPIGMKESLAQFLQRQMAGEQEMAQRVRRAYAMAGQAEMAFQAADVAPAYGPAEAGEMAEDLFLYPAGRLTLAPDRVAYIPLFTESVPYEHLYQWTIPDTIDEAAQFRPRPPQPDEDKEQEVWHSIRLENTTKVPWTPAPVEVVERGMILGQDMITYTPAGGEATVRIGRAADIRAEQRELEIDRTREAAQFYDAFFDRVTIEGKLTVTSHKDQPVTLEITKTLSGEVQSTDPEAKIEQLAAGLKRMNPQTKLTWEIDLQPDEEQQITYTYQAYIRR